jgi:DeoR/GlpR family transcriptional regulator of sugar metabolism
MTQRSAPYLPAERRAVISRIVVESEAVRVAELAAEFEVNPATIRRDLEKLEQQGKLRRVYGGAVPAEPEGRAGAQIPSDSGAARIGRAAAEMIADGETIYIGAGELCLATARSLADRDRLTVITNGLDIAHWLAANTAHPLIVTGGHVEGRRLGLGGQLGLQALSSMRADQVILQLDGVSASGGLTVDSLPQAEMAKAILETGSCLIVLVEPDRLGRVAAAHIAPATEADSVVTVREAPSSFLWDLSECGVRIVLA